ncbi:MAG TPA: hypothetical protein VGR35_06135 [Tepidisphaeraceae bacterium]|nr:hypothetical protein [Tepidisphaeraceae bacterium]
MLVRLALVVAVAMLPITGCAQRSAAAGSEGSGDTRAARPKSIATVEEVLNSGTDLWGEAALKQPDGPSYAFFADLLEPMRYCDAPFRHYPLTLGAPHSPVKARLISNGSAINDLARQRNWINETGTPVTIRVGRDLAVFGEDLARLEGPKFAQGYYPIVQLRYRHDGHAYEQEVFAPTDEEGAQHGVAYARFTVTEGGKGRSGSERAGYTGKGKVEAQIEGYVVHKVADGIVRDNEGKVVATFEPGKWWYTPGRGTLITELEPGESSVLAIYTKPIESTEAVTPAMYDAKRNACIQTWDQVLKRGMNIVTPEPRVNDAWRATVIANYMMLNGDEMRYSHGNQYDKLYIAEPADTTRALALLGQSETARRAIPPIMNYTRKGLEYHQAALKLQMLAHYYFLTRDADFIRSMRLISEEGRKPGWQTELDLLLSGRERKSGLFPPEKYAGDIADHVYSLNSNANGWRGLRDMAIVLGEIGETPLAEKAAASAVEFRKAVIAALDKSIDRSIEPPFVPVALFGEEKPYDMIFKHRMGSYWNIMSKYVLTSGVFPIESDYADMLIDYAQERGGLCMGMNRTCTNGTQTWWVDTRGINDLYGMRYALALLERDEPDRALVSFYGKLAHGFTRDTFVGCEGSSILPMYGDEQDGGRQMYLPPNSAANASFQQQLRYLLVQDYDAVNDDGRADTLRLLFATPRSWLADGKEIRVERAPTQFGEVSFTVRSRLKEGAVTADLKLPERTPSKTFIRLRLPDGWRVTSAEANGIKLEVNEGATINLAPVRGDVKLRATVKKG